MSNELIKSELNLFAVLKSMEDLVKYDPDTTALTKNWNVSIQFTVKNGPAAYIKFENGACSVEKGKMKRPAVKLFFTSPSHLNKMMDGNGSPIPLKGFTKLKFLTKDFPMATDKLEYYLKPTDELLKDDHFVEMNTRMTLTVASNSLDSIARLDTLGKFNAKNLMEGAIQIEVKEGGPVLHMICKNGAIESKRGPHDSPLATMALRNMKTANDFFLGKVDTFLAIASEDVVIMGQIKFADAISQLLGRIEHYI